MITLNRFFILSALLTASAASASEGADSMSAVIGRLNCAQSQMWQMTPQAFVNPAMKQWMLPVSVSAIKASYDRSRLNQPVDIQQGEGSDAWKAGAESYMKYRTSTLWGAASYSGGHEFNPVWNESSDLGLIYPYVVADSIGGNIKSETYSLGGGYADHTDRWAWGATISYVAGLHYRNVDPRPRNVTGRLDISAGGAWLIPATDYRLGASVGYMRYKQSADIEFVNDLADNRIWHLTGLGTNYDRFSSQGYSHSYQGHRLSATLGVHPQSGRGLSVTGAVQRFTFDHILTSLNNMPLQSAAETIWRLEAAWLQPGERHDLAATVAIMTGSRQGTENIFGDAAAGIYPQIGSLTMYRHAMTQASLRLLWQYHPTKSLMVALTPRALFSRSRQSYADPRRLMLLSDLTTGLEASARRNFGPNWNLRASLSADFTSPLDCNLDLSIDPSAPLGMQLAEIRRYDILSEAHHRIEATMSATRAISRRYALMLSASYARRDYSQSIHSNDFSTSLSFIF